MPYIEFDNKKIYHNSTGQGTPLLLLHGNVVSSLMFKQEIEFYKDFFQVIYFDYPGHGKSERLEKFHTDFWYYNSLAAKKILGEYTSYWYKRRCSRWVESRGTYTRKNFQNDCR